MSSNGKWHLFCVFRNDNMSCSSCSCLQNVYLVMQHTTRCSWGVGTPLRTSGGQRRKWLESLSWRHADTDVSITQLMCVWCSSLCTGAPYIEFTWSEKLFEALYHSFSSELLNDHLSLYPDYWFWSFFRKSCISVSCRIFEQLIKYMSLYLTGPLNQSRQRTLFARRGQYEQQRIRERVSLSLILVVKNQVWEHTHGNNFCHYRRSATKT